MEWYKKDPSRKVDSSEKSDLPPGLWKRCDRCKEFIFIKDLERTFGVCPRCNLHYRIDSWSWLALLFGDRYCEYDQNLRSTDPLNFVDTKPYPLRLHDAQEKTGLFEAAVTARGELEGWPLYVTVLDFRFLGGSMGSVVGEKLARGAERALGERIPYLTILSTGGARMQEGMLSLMQMAKTAMVLSRLHLLRIPYIVYLSDPSTAGCLASFGMIGDLILAEPDALIGFAGPRVIEQTIGERLPEGFQRAEFQLEHGMVDRVVNRSDLKSELARILRFFGLASPLRLPTVKDIISGRTY